MRHFTSITQLPDLAKALEAAKYVKENPFADQELGRNKTLLMIFFNSSLRTRLSTQKAALNLGMNVIVLDVNQGACGSLCSPQIFPLIGGCRGSRLLSHRDRLCSFAYVFRHYRQVCVETAGREKGVGRSAADNRVLPADLYSCSADRQKCRFTQ